MLNTVDTFQNRLKEAMALRGIRASQLSVETGLSKARISQYTNGVYNPGPQALFRLATALAVSERWLMGEDVPMERIPASGATTFSNVAPVSVRPFPVLGDIACGQPILTEGHSDGSFVRGTEDFGADFCLIARGDSMIGARIHDGDEVFIQQTDLVNNGEIAAVIINDEATLKRVYYYPEENKLVLSPENPDYEPLEFVGEDLNQIHILGRAVAFQSKLR